MATPAQRYREFLAFIRLGRPYFLAGGLVMHALGVAAALYGGASLNWLALILGQVAITSTQWMVHYANDYFDVTPDRLNTFSTVWSGGSRVLPNGELEPRLALRTAVTLAFLSTVAAVALIVVAGSDAVGPLLIGTTLLLSWGYSAPPFRWQSRGIGEFGTALIVAVLTPTLGFYLQASYIPRWLPLAVWAPFCLQLCFNLCVNFPDRTSDTVAGKRTLVVRHERAARVVYLASLTAAYLAAPLMILAGLPIAVVLAVLLPAPVAIWLFRRANRGGLTDPKCWVANEWGNVVLVMLTSAAEAVAFAASRS